MAKIELDKYYTSKELAEYVINKTKEIIGEENITEYLEPSAGGGVFLDYLPSNTLAYDIEPEDDRIIKQDYLTLDLDYKKGRCIIGNPPYTYKKFIYKQFYKSSVKISDYIVFILPISQLKDSVELYEFDLIYSEDLGIQEYSKVNIHCCLNIYKRPLNNKFNKKPNYELKDVRIQISEVRKEGSKRKSKFVYKSKFDYDIRICAWGSSMGKEVEFEHQYALELSIKINNKNYRELILKIIRNANWKEIYPMMATPYLNMWKVYKYIKEQIPKIS